MLPKITPNQRLALNSYWIACGRIQEEFIGKYYLDKDTKRSDIEDYWIADEIGGLIFINDYYHSIDDMVEALRLNCPVDKFFKWYDESMIQVLSPENGRFKYNLRSYLKLEK